MIPADPALRWDTPLHPPASRAEPPNSAQLFLFQVLCPMKCLNRFLQSVVNGVWSASITREFGGSFIEA